MIVVVRTNVDAASTGADATVDRSVGSAETRLVQSTAPGQTRVIVRVPVKGRPEGPSETVNVSMVTMLLASETTEIEASKWSAGCYRSWEKRNETSFWPAD